MAIEAANFRLPEVDPEPTGDMMLDWLIDHDKEEPYLDFKEILDVSKTAPFQKIAKDFFAFSNYGGGFILIGFRHKTKFPKLAEKISEDTKEEEIRFEHDYVPVGLSEAHHIDQATLQQKFNSFSPEPLTIDYREFTRMVDGIPVKLAAVYVPPSTSPLKANQDGVYTDSKGKKRTAFSKDDVLFRRGTQSVPASVQEISWIEKRCLKEQYKLSILSGNTDEITESIFSNLFEVTKLPENIWSAVPYKVEAGQESKLNKNGNYYAVFVDWKGQIVTFDDISNPNSPLHEGVVAYTIESEPISAWIEDAEKRNTLIHLMNREIRMHAYKMGLIRETKKNKFYFECSGESRVENWKSRFRESSALTVAQKMWANQLSRFIYWNLAVIAKFTFVGSRPFLRLSPSLLITNDGKDPLVGSKEGTIITRMTHDRYNASYLNHVLFWISRLSKGGEIITLARGKLTINPKPCETKLAYGIMADRPTSEPLQEEPIIEIAKKNQ